MNCVAMSPDFLNASGYVISVWYVTFSHTDGGDG